jgi:hypothetical protein
MFSKIFIFAIMLTIVNANQVVPSNTNQVVSSNTNHMVPASLVIKEAFGTVSTCALELGACQKTIEYISKDLDKLAKTKEEYDKLKTTIALTENGRDIVDHIEDLVDNNVEKQKLVEKNCLARIETATNHTIDLAESTAKLANDKSNLTITNLQKENAELQTENAELQSRSNGESFFACMCACFMAFLLLAAMWSDRPDKFTVKQAINQLITGCPIAYGIGLYFESLQIGTVSQVGFSDAGEGFALCKILGAGGDWVNDNCQLMVATVAGLGYKPVHILSTFALVFAVSIFIRLLISGPISLPKTLIIGNLFGGDTHIHQTIITGPNEPIATPMRDPVVKQLNFDEPCEETPDDFQTPAPERYVTDTPYVRPKRRKRKPAM